MQEPFLLSFLFSLLLHLRFYQKGPDELVDALHRFYFWLVHQRMLDLYTGFNFESSNSFHFLEFTLSQSQFVCGNLDCENCFTLETGGHQTFTKFCTDLSAVPLFLYNFCSLWRSYFLGGRGFFSLFLAVAIWIRT